MKDGSLTGIPLDVIYMVMITMAGVIYADLKHELRQLRKAGDQRDAQLVHLTEVMRRVCRELKIPFGRRDGDTPWDVET